VQAEYVGLGDGTERQDLGAGRVAAARKAARDAYLRRLGLAPASLPPLFADLLGLERAALLKSIVHREQLRLASESPSSRKLATLAQGQDAARHTLSLALMKRVQQLEDKREEHFESWRELDQLAVEAADYGDATSEEHDADRAREAMDGVEAQLRDLSIQHGHFDTWVASGQAASWARAYAAQEALRAHVLLRDEDVGEGANRQVESDVGQRAQPSARRSGAGLEFD
jgi:hypothetical protein